MKNAKEKIIGLALVLIGMMFIMFVAPSFIVFCFAAPCPPLPGYYVSIGIGSVLIVIGLVLIVWSYKKSG